MYTFASKAITLGKAEAREMPSENSAAGGGKTMRPSPVRGGPARKAPY